MRVPAVPTCTFERIRREVVSARASVGLAVARTSTRVPGSTYPATPTTSFTRTDTARMPSGITGGRPEPASFDASFALRIGSFFTTLTIRPRPRVSAGAFKGPGGGWAPGGGADRQAP